MELKPSPDTDDFRYFDPKLLKASEGGSTFTPKSRAPYQDAIVFMVGGGTYAEYQNLIDYAKVNTPSYRQKSCHFLIIFIHITQAKTVGGSAKRIVYGCSTLNNGSQFLKQVIFLYVSLWKFFTLIFNYFIFNYFSWHF